MKRKLTALLAVVASVAALAAIAAAPAGASTGTTCTAGSGTLTASPGLSETPKVQNLVAKGTLTGCGEGATTQAFVVHLKSSKAVSCLSLYLEGSGSASGTGIVKWGRTGGGNSLGTALLSGSIATGATLTGSIESGPFAGLGYSTPITGVTPIFAGTGTPCSKTNPLKKAGFTSGAFTIS